MSAPQEPTEEQLLEALRRVKVDDVLLQTVATLVNLAGQKLTVPEAKDPAEAKKAIDAARAMLPLVPEDAADQIKDALSQVQMIYVRDQQQAGAQPAEPGGPTAQDEERAKARAKIWTPGS
jgi:FtsZ-interacting cell division protein ZipA